MKEKGLINDEEFEALKKKKSSIKLYADQGIQDTFLLAAINFTHILDFMIMMPLGNYLIPSLVCLLQVYHLGECLRL